MVSSAFEDEKSEREYRKGVDSAIEAVQASIDKTKDRGLSVWTFFIGILNIALTAFLVGRCPQHYWVLHTIKAGPLFFTAVKMKNERHELMYLFDFCWVVNFVLFLVSVFLVLKGLDQLLVNKLPFEALLTLVRGPSFGRTIFVLATGPVAGYCYTLGPPLNLHDVLHFTNFFLHFTPTVLMWTLRWHKEAVTAAWAHSFAQYHVMPTDPAALGYWEVTARACSLHVPWP